MDRGRLVNAPFKIWKADLLDAGVVDAVLDSVRPDWVINCAALANLEDCENTPSLARTLNTDLPAQMAKACKLRNISFAHISTDAVFDGTKEGFYTENDAPNPLGIYSQTKLDGEYAVMNENNNAIIARVNFYGWSLSGKRSLAEFFHHNLTNNKSMSGFTDVIFCPMFVNHTVRTLIKMLEKKLSGMYHLVGTQSMSKYQFGVELSRKFGLKESEILPKSVNSSNLTARRSHNLALSTHKLSTDLGESLPEFSTGLEEFFTQYQQGFPQKIKGYQG
jgi:dTDP-4-dehydrorhamnose reductase